jgi:FKBP-type peptidyl-prolyl cis-trans isomerase FkpA
MKKTLALFAVVALAGCQGGAGGAGGAGPTPQTEEQKTLYALGLSLGRALSAFSLSEDELRYVQRGIYDQVLGKTPVAPYEQYAPKLQEMARSRSQAKTAAEKTKSQEYLDKVAQEPGVKKLPSGVLYKETQAGTGETPKPSDVVKVNYRGTLINGTEFDSSFKRNQPAQFPLSGVVPCWTEGIQQMKVGGKAQLVCPSNTAYGDRGAPPNIPGGAALIFDVELLGIQPSAPPPEFPPGHPAMPGMSMPDGGIRIQPIRPPPPKPTAPNQ